MSPTSTVQVAVVHIGQRRLSLHTVGVDDGSVDCASGPPGTGGSARWVDLSSVPGQPHEACFDPRRRLLYVTHTYVDGWYLVNGGPGRHVSVVDPDTAQLVGSFDLGAGPDPVHGAHDLWFDAARDQLWVSDEGDEAASPSFRSPAVSGGRGASGALVGLDPESGRRRTRIGVGARAAHWFAVDPDRARAYTANKEAPFVSVLDLDTEQLVDQITVPGSEGIAAGPDGRVFVAGPCRLPGVASAPPGVRVIDADAGSVVGLLETAHAPGAVHLSGGGLLLAAEMRVATGEGEPVDGLLSVFSADTLEPLGEVPIGASVLTITSSTDGALAFVADAHGGKVTVVDLTALRVHATIENTPGAHGMAVIPPRA